jgi:hypothetical protein
MILNVLGQSKIVRAYHEGEGVILETECFRLLSEQSVREAIDRTPEPVILFKPLNDSQYLDNLLSLHPAAKAIWVYRHYRDVVSSSLEKWQDAHRTMIYEVAKGQFSNLGRKAIGERVTPENLARVRALAKTPLSPEEGAALLWYLRNAIYFDLNLANTPNVLLSKYEDLVTLPGRYFRILFDFVGIGPSFSLQFISRVHVGSVGKRTVTNIGPEIEALCDDMIKRLNEDYYRQPIISA